MTEQKVRIAKPVLVAATLATIVWVSAGSLTPPAGPIAPTQRIPVGDDTTPGDAISLFKISQPGSYYLTGNITGVAGKTGIDIAVGGVTLDLMGFRMEGGAGTLDGIQLSVAAPNIAIRNGAIVGWGQRGVNSLLGTGGLLEGLMASGNVGDGIGAGSGTVVTGCASASNGGDGFSLNPGCTITACSARSNTGIGFFCGTMAVITGCSSSNNGSIGIDARNGSTVANCSARDNTGDGFNLGNGVTMTSCTSYSNSSNGIDAADGCTISNCTVSANGLRGIEADNNATITGCTADGNVLDGIRVNTNSRVTNNTCNANGNGLADTNSGIRLDGAGNRAEGNSATNNDSFGIDVDAAGNVVIRNWCRGNTTPIGAVAGNLIGPMVTTADIATEDSAQANFSN